MPDLTQVAFDASPARTTSSWLMQNSTVPTTAAMRVVARRWRRSRTIRGASAHDDHVGVGGGSGDVRGVISRCCRTGPFEDLGRTGLRRCRSNCGPPANPERQHHELEIFDQDPPPKRLRHVHAEAATVVEREPACEGLHAERRPRERDADCGCGRSPTSRAGACEQPDAGRDLARDQPGGDDSRERWAGDPVRHHDIDEPARIGELTRSHRKQEHGERPPADIGPPRRPRARHGAAAGAT